MDFMVVIPARFGATRLPGKPLLDIGGKPMLQHVYERACRSQARAVVIATDDDRIRCAAEGFGAQVCMTSAAHRSGTDRIEEVARQLGLASDACVVNVQGDEPLLPAAAIDQVAANLVGCSDAGISTLCEPITRQEELDSPHAVKVVFDKQGFALYFSRAAIPHGCSVQAGNAYRHIGIYGYRVSTLTRFVTWPPALLEVTEKLEQLRALVNGVRIHVAVTSHPIPAGVDTEEDLAAVRAYVAGMTGSQNP
ncbi:MAG: hypothetical protein RLZZ385_2450 [Pseudomonadota bacterium]|jgi:3-deoxy-manno-octulosonate cytidylyltransferase (CMP-KDO synthetase)